MKDLSNMRQWSECTDSNVSVMRVFRHTSRQRCVRHEGTRINTPYVQVGFGDMAKGIVVESREPFITMKETINRTRRAVRGADAYAVDRSVRRELQSNCPSVYKLGLFNAPVVVSDGAMGEATD